MSEFEFRTTADVDEFATAIWESVGSGVDDKIDDQAWDAVSTQVSEAINEDAWDAVSDSVYDAAREAAEEYGSNSDGVEETLSELLRTYNTISVGAHCTIGERATELVTKVIQYHLDTSYEDGGLLSTQVVPSCLPRVEALEARVEGLATQRIREEAEVDRQIQGANEGLQRVTVLEDKVAGLAEENALLWVKVNDLTGMVSRLQATTAGFRAKHDTPEGVLAYAEATLKHILIAVQDSRGHAVNSVEPF